MNDEKVNANLPEQTEQEILNCEELENLEGGVGAELEEVTTFLRQGVSHCCNGSASETHK